MRPGLEKTINEVFTEITAEHAGPLWNQLSVEVKGEIFAQAMDRSPSLVSQMMEEIKQDPYYVFDIKGMVVSHLESNKQLINYIFQQCGAKEFKFIEKSGAVLGFIFGLFQAFAWCLIINNNNKIKKNLLLCSFCLVVFSPYSYPHHFLTV